MTEICMSFEVHQPFRINTHFTAASAKNKTLNDLFDLYFNNTWNKLIFERVANKCYLPTNQIILDNIDLFKKEKLKFKVAYSISGTLMEQCERWAPDLMDSFKQLGESGCVEFLCQTYFHSLSSIFSSDRREFIEQVEMHRRMIEDFFKQRPIVFENTEMIYNNSIAQTAAKLGFKGIFTEGAERILGWKSPNYVYEDNDSTIKVLLRNYRLSDDVSFRFSNRNWSEYPLMADKYASWLSSSHGKCINIFMDYETFGEHQWPETGIHDFLKCFPGEILKHDNLEFSTPSELLKHRPVGKIDVHDFSTVSWADTERSTNAWLGNDMQRTCFRGIKNLEPYVRATKDEKILKLWRLLQVSDNIYFMYTGGGGPGAVHGYFSQQPPVETFWGFMRVLSDFYEKLAEKLGGEKKISATFRRFVPPDKAFHFHIGRYYINLSAHSLDELAEVVKKAPESSLRYHVVLNDFESWIGETIGDKELAGQIAKLDPTSDDLRGRIYLLIKEKLKILGSGEDD